MGLFQGLFHRSAGKAAEQRAAKSEALPLRDPALGQLFGMGMRTASGVSITVENARECPEVDACISLIEDTIGTLPLDLYERVDADTRRRVSDHPLHILLHDRPNSWQSSAEFRIMMEGWRQTYGNAYARILLDRRTGFAAALEPMHPNDVRCFRRSSGGYAYDCTGPNGQSETLLPFEVLHLRDKPYKRNLLEGESKVLRHRETIARVRATAEYMARFFSNNAVPKTFIQTPNKLNKEQEEALRDQYERKHGGLENQHRLGVMQGGLELKTLGINNTDAQLIEAYQLGVVQIARIWGIPLHMINELSKSTSFGTGLEQQSIGFIVYYMRPKYVVWEQALNRTLLTAEQQQRYYYEFNADGLLRGDFKTRMEGYALLVQWGLMSINEIRRQLNLPPVDGGDERLQPLNMAPASKILEVLLKGSKTPEQTKP